jgi:hypothetical protein
MSRFARRGHHDANHADVAQFYRDLGCSVADTSAAGFGFPDMAVGCVGVTNLVEVKDEDGNLSASQQRFIRDWRGGPIVVVRTFDEVVTHIQRIRSARSA